MSKYSIVLAAAAVVAALATPASADGPRRYARGSGYAIGAISRNVITPWYVGYYPSHYSYYKPDPRPARIYYDYEFSCWRWGYRGC